MKPVHGLMVRDWKEDVVQLVQFPRTHTVISSSPYAIKLETWLRINGLKYHNVSNDFTKASAKGQIPFIELNGRQFADSNFIIEHLRSHFKLPIDGQLNSQERADARAYHVLIEESLARCLQYDRSKNMGWMASDKGYFPHMPGYQKFIFQKILIKQMQNRYKKSLHMQGYGRHSPEEIEEIVKKDLAALSTQLGNKPFMFGNTPTTLDATLFGHLVQFTDTPLNSDKIKPFLEQSTPNLVEFIKRMKETYWPDWAQICEMLALNPEDIAKKEAEQAAAAEAAAAVAAAAATAAESATPVAAVSTTETTTVVQTQA